MNEQETIADIVAEMRGKEFDDPHLDRDGIIGARRLARGWADRLEAAHKHECGDAAKLREACIYALAELEHFRKCHDARLHFCDIVHVGNVKHALKAALDAPPRNCDRFATADEAIGAYRQTHKHMVVNVFLDWLFALSTEKKGGAK